MKRIWLLIAACVCNTLFRYNPFCFQFGNPEENHTSYAVGQAASYLLLLAYVRNRKMTPWEGWVFDIVAWCAFNNLLDELFFNPLEFGWNEKVFVVVVVCWASWRAYNICKKIL